MALFQHGRSVFTNNLLADIKQNESDQYHCKLEYYNVNTNSSIQSQIRLKIQQLKQAHLSLLSSLKILDPTNSLVINNYEFNEISLLTAEEQNLVDILNNELLTKLQAIFTENTKFPQIILQNGIKSVPLEVKNLINKILLSLENFILKEENWHNLRVKSLDFSHQTTGINQIDSLRDDAVNEKRFKCQEMIFSLLGVDDGCLEYGEESIKFCEQSDEEVENNQMVEETNVRSNVLSILSFIRFVIIFCFYSMICIFKSMFIGLMKFLRIYKVVKNEPKEEASLETLNNYQQCIQFKEIYRDDDSAGEYW